MPIWFIMKLSGIRLHIARTAHVYRRAVGVTKSPTPARTPYCLTMRVRCAGVYSGGDRV